MVNINILQEGSFEQKGETVKSRCSVVLLRGKFGNALLDVGGPGDGENLLNELKKLGVSPEDINYIFLTHRHADHNFNLPLFKKATFIEAGDEFKFGETVFKFGDWKTIKNTKSLLPEFKDEDIWCQHLPGHTTMDMVIYFHGDLMDGNEVLIPKRKFLFTGDVFGNGMQVKLAEEERKLDKLSESLAEDSKGLAESRGWILSQKRIIRIYEGAPRTDIDYIIPGHGKICFHNGEEAWWIDKKKIFKHRKDEIENYNLVFFEEPVWRFKIDILHPKTGKNMLGMYQHFRRDNWKRCQFGSEPHKEALGESYSTKRKSGVNIEKLLEDLKKGEIPILTKRDKAIENFSDSAVMDLIFYRLFMIKESE